MALQERCHSIKKKGVKSKVVATVTEAKFIDRTLMSSVVSRQVKARFEKNEKLMK